MKKLAFIALLMAACPLVYGQENPLTDDDERYVDPAKKSAQQPQQPPKKADREEPPSAQPSGKESAKAAWQSIRDKTAAAMQSVKEVVGTSIDVSGRITDSKGNPLADMEVIACDSRKKFDMGDGIDGDHTDESGFYSLKGVPKDGLLIMAYPGFENVQFEAVDGRATINVQTLALDGETITLRGKVRSSKGDKISGATVAASGINVDTTTDEYGSFKLEALNGGTLIVAADGYITQVVQVSGARIDVQMERVK